MGDLVSLRKVRKKMERARDQQRAATNRLRFGLSKAEHRLKDARDKKARQDLDQHQVETGDDR